MLRRFNREFACRVVEHDGFLGSLGPLGRLNTADSCGTPKADKELKEFRQRFGSVAYSAFLCYDARLIEVTYALERMEMLLDDPQILETHVRTVAGVNM